MGNHKNFIYFGIAAGDLNRTCIWRIDFHCTAIVNDYRNNLVDQSIKIR